MIPKKIVRRNSTIIFFEENDDIYVKKSYHSTYDISDEIEAYKRLNKILDSRSNIRTANIIDVTKESIILEYVAGTPLDSINDKTVGILSMCRDDLNSLFFDCHRSSFKFDSDTLNLFYSPNEQKIIIIDPVCKENDISYYTFVVFTISIIKAFTKNFNPAYIKKTFQLFNTYIDSFNSNYAHDFRKLRHSFVQYIKKIINWNMVYNKKENKITYLWRCVAVIPYWVAFLMGIRIYFSLKASKIFSSKVS